MTRKLALRKLNNRDGYYWCNELAPGTNLQSFGKFFEDISLQERQEKSYSFILEGNGAPIGFVQVFNVLRYPACSGMVEIMIQESKRKHGFAKEGIKLLEDYCFKDLGLMRLIAPISPENKASIALFSSLGYQKYFTDPSAFFFNKKPAPHEIWVKINLE